MTGFEQTLRAVIDCIIPADEDPGALALGTDRFVVAVLADNRVEAEPIIAGLALLENAATSVHARTFGMLDAEQQAAMLDALGAEPWFNRLVTLTSEGYYADPDNGGNAGAASWTMIGYQHRLPEGPSGPPAPLRFGLNR